MCARIHECGSAVLLRVSRYVEMSNERNLNQKHLLTLTATSVPNHCPEYTTPKEPRPNKCASFSPSTTTELADEVELPAIIISTFEMI